LTLRRSIYPFCSAKTLIGQKYHFYPGEENLGRRLALMRALVAPKTEKGRVMAAVMFDTYSLIRGELTDARPVGTCFFM